MQRACPVTGFTSALRHFGAGDAGSPALSAKAWPPAKRMAPQERVQPDLVSSSCLVSSMAWPRGKLTLAKKLCRDWEPNGEEPGLSIYRGRVRQQPRCPRAPRAGYETTWRRLMRAWLGPKPGSLSIRRSIQRGNTRQLQANCRKLRALKRQLRRCARIYPRRHEAAPAERGGGCGGTRSRQQAWSYAERATDLPADDEPSPQTRQDRGAVPISAASSTALPGKPCFD